MSKRQRRNSTWNKRKARLMVELLEDRCLLDVAAATSPLAHIALIPNNPDLSSQWALVGSDGIHAEAAWNVTTGSMSTVVGVIDTGLDYDHPDLYQNVWVNQAEIPDFWYTKSSASSTTYDKLVLKSQIQTAIPGVITFADLNSPANKGLVWDNNGDGIIDAGDLLRPLSQGGWDNNGHDTKDGDTAHPDDFFGWNFVANNNNPFDDNGHGTHVAGIIGAKGNSGVGVAGIDWNVQLMSLKVFDSSGGGPVTNAVAALNYAVAHGAQITNNSWSMGTATYQPLADAIQNAAAHNVIFVAASGNYGVNTDTTPEYPASYNFSNVVSVAASNTDGTLTSYSDYGAHSVSIAAPGQNILSTYPGGKYQILSGTSMAAPQVTGVLGLIRSLHPTWSAAQDINQLLSSADRLSSLTGKVESGLLDAARAVGATGQVTPSTGGTPTPTPAPAPSVTPQITAFVPEATGSAHVSYVVVTFNEAINTTTFTAADITLTGPNGAIPITGITPVAGSGNTKFQILFATQRTVGVYKMTIGPNILDNNGHGMAQSFSSTFTIDPLYQFTGNGPLAVRGGSTTTSTVTITKDITIADLKVTVLLSYPHLSDLVIRLTGPGGTSVLLSNRDGGSGNNLVSAVFSDAASTTLNQAKAPFSGSYRPDTPLSVFDSKDARGTWTFTVQDVVAGTSGSLSFFTLNIDGALNANGTPASVGDSEDQPAETPTPATADAAAAPAGTAAVAPLIVTPAAGQGAQAPTYLFLGMGTHPAATVEEVESPFSTPVSVSRTSAGAAQPRLQQAAADLVFAAARGGKNADPLTVDLSPELLQAYFETVR
jgi:serine protease